MLEKLKNSYDKECFAMELVVLKVLKNNLFHNAMEDGKCIIHIHIMNMCMNMVLPNFYPLNIIFTIIHMVCHM
jgi:hypothetical protein